MTYEDKLNKLVATRVMGWKLHTFGMVRYWVPKDKTVTERPDWRQTYSMFIPATSIAAAWQVVERMRELGFSVTVMDGHGTNWVASYNVSVVGATAPLAICLAALETLGVKPPAKPRKSKKKESV